MDDVGTGPSALGSAVPKLKPCPFCAGSAELREEHDNAWVQCEPCGFSLEGYATVADAVAAWNRRDAERVVAAALIDKTGEIKRLCWREALEPLHNSAGDEDILFPAGAPHRIEPLFLATPVAAQSSSVRKDAVPNTPVNSQSTEKE